MPNKFGKAVRKLKKGRAAERQQISGLLGVIRGGAQVVEVVNRNSFVWVRLRGRVSELIQAFNDAVSPVYNLPVIVERDRTNPSRYRVVSRDVGRYSDWGSFSAYLPNHGNQHSFRDDGAGGGDIVWIYSKQFMPGLVCPSGSAGGMNVEVREFSYYQNDAFHTVGNTGTASLLPYKPTGSSANMTLVYLDTDSGNPQLLAGSHFDASITGSAAITPYLPSLPSSSDIPLAGIRLISGSSYVGWDNIYDFREFFRPTTDVPVDASFLTVSLNPTLTHERRLVAGTGITINDGGAGGDLTISTVGGTGSVTHVAQDDGWTAQGGNIDQRTLTIVDGNITLDGDGTIDFGALMTVTFPGTCTVAGRNITNTFTRAQTVSPTQEEVGLNVQKSSYQSTSDLQRWSNQAAAPISRVDVNGYFHSEMTEVDVPDYPMAGVTGTYDHFRQDGASYPATWTEINGSTGTSTNYRLSYWKLNLTQSDASFRYRLHGTPNYSTSVTDGNYGVYNFGPLLAGAGNGHEDVHYYFGVYKDNAGSFFEDAYCRAHLWWDAATMAWKLRGEEGDGDSGDYETPDHAGSWKTLGVPFSQPVWLSVRIHQHIVPNPAADHMESRVYVGTHPLLDTQESVFDVIPTSVADAYGTAWIEVEGSLDTGASGSSASLYFGGYDFTQHEY